MSTSDQNGEPQLTRKQLREIRLTGSTPVITEEEAAAQVAAPAAPPRAAEPVTADPTPGGDDESRLTRREMRAQERVRTASVPVGDSETDAPTDESDTVDEVVEEEAGIVSAVPAFPAPVAAASVVEADVDEQHDAHDAEATEDAEQSEDEAPAETAADEPAAEDETPAEEAADVTESDADAEHSADAEQSAQSDDIFEAAATEDAAEAEPAEDADARPTVNSGFGQSVGASAAATPIPQLFDDLIDADSGGSQHTAPSAMIFTPAPGEASLSGPVASTGELLVTGSYDLPEGLGSRGHARGTTDGKDVDAVLIDGELPPTSSPTPIAASSAVSTSKPAGEVIRPPAPDKGNKLMLTLAIVAGGLAIALAAVLVVAFTTNVFG